MRSRTRFSALLGASLVVVLTAAALTACGQSDDGPNENVPTVTPATAAQSPLETSPPAGTRLAVGPAVAVVANRGGDDVTAVLDAKGTTVQLVSAPRAADSPAPKLVPVPELKALTHSSDGFVGAGPSGVVHIDTAGAVSVQEQKFDGTPLSVAAMSDGRVLVGTDKGHVLVIGKDGKQIRDIGGWVRVDDITVAPQSAGDRAGQVAVLDRAQSAVTPVDVDSGELKAALRAGDGATNATVDDIGRIFVSGTRNNEFYSFYGQPIVMRLRAPASESPYALAYDAKSKLLWVSSTASNTAAAYDLSTGEAVEKHRITTIPQVSAMDVDPHSGALLLVSNRDGAQLETVLPTEIKEG